MKEVRRKKGRVQSFRVLGSTLVPLVVGLARLVRPLVDIIVVAASVLAPPCIGRTAEGLAVRRTVLHRVQPLHGRPVDGLIPGSGVATSGYRPVTTGRASAVVVAACERDAQIVVVAN